MFELLDILFKKIKLIIGICLITALITAGVSLLLPNVYKSTVIFQPANPNSFDVSVVFPSEGQSNPPINIFGNNSDRDRIISLGTSSDLYNHIIQKFDLFNHYEIDPHEQYANFKLQKEISKNYEIQKNPQNAIELFVYDKNPEFTAALANEIYAKINELNSNVIFKSKHEVKNILNQQSKELASKADQLKTDLQNSLVVNPKDTITTSYINSKLKNVLKELNSVDIKLDQYNKLLSQNSSTLYLIEKAYVPDRKDSPKRSQIVIGATIFMFVFLIILFVFIEQYKMYLSKTES